VADAGPGYSESRKSFFSFHRTYLISAFLAVAAAAADGDGAGGAVVNGELKISLLYRC